MERPVRVNGPYLVTSGRTEGRRVVDLLFADGTRTSMLYSKYLMQEEADWTLKKHDHVHHVNEDKTDDRPENLAVVDIGEHARHHRLQDRPHGTTTRYNSGCRCALCRAAQSARNKEYYERRKGLSR